MKLNTIIQGDTLQTLKSWPDEFVDTIITSCPYWGLRDYQTATWEGGDEKCDHITGRANRTITEKSKKQTTVRGSFVNETKDVCPKCGAKRIDQQIGLEPTLDEYLYKMLVITNELHRVLKKTGVMFWNHGDNYGSSISGGLAKEKGDGLYERKMNRIRSQKKTDPRRNIDPSKIKAKCLVLQNYRLILKMIDEQGWILRNSIVWHKPNAMPSSVKDRFSNSYEPVFMLVKSKKYNFDLDAVRVKTVEPYSEKRARRPETSKRKAIHGSGLPAGNFTYNKLNPAGKNPGDIWKIATHPFLEAHFATFPPKLIEPMVKAGSPKGGLVCDPFMGSGTTALVARKHNRNYIGIELSEAYIKIANKRLAQEHLGI